MLENSLSYVYDKLKLKEISDKLKLNEYKARAITFASNKSDVVLLKIQEFLKDQNIMDDSEIEDRNRIILLIGGAGVTILIGVLLVVRLIYNIIYTKFIHQHHHHHSYHIHRHHHKHSHRSKDTEVSTSPSTLKKEN